MDFFQHQEQARQRTGLLVLLFALAVVAISAVLSGVVVMIHAFTSSGEPLATETVLRYCLATFAGVSVVVLGAVTIRLIDLSNSGGAAVAEKLGGRLISSNTSNRQHRQLLNVVEEMAIASGMPVPPVYLLANEQGINAFAAGLSLDDAALGITQGALDAFTREELQGVIAHEFSHVLNGDMRLNTRLMGILFGITFLGYIGSFLFDSTSHRSYRVSSSSDSSKATIALFLIGLAFMLLGWAGTLFGSMIKAAISRQREFLADASAVQFTRNDQGIAGALKKIGAHSQGAILSASEAQEASHMMFGQSQLKGLNNLFATHPPLEERIARIEPNWDGQYIAPSKPKAQPSQQRSETQPERVAPIEILGSVLAAGVATQQMGAFGQQVIAELPTELTALAREPFSARFIPVLLIFDGSEEQHAIIARKVPMGLWGKISPWLDYTVPSHLRLTLLELAIPAMKSLSPSQAEALISLQRQLADSDNEYSIKEWCVINLVEKMILPSLGSVKQGKSLTKLAERAELVVSELAWVCHEDATQAAKAYTLAAKHLSLDNQSLGDRLGQWDTTKIALQLLVQLKPMDKQRFLEACRLAIESDGEITTEEAELYRVIACFLEVPVSPLAITPKQ